MCICIDIGTFKNSWKNCIRKFRHICLLQVSHMRGHVMQQPKTCRWQCTAVSMSRVGWANWKSWSRSTYGWNIQGWCEVTLFLSNPGSLGFASWPLTLCYAKGILATSHLFASIIGQWSWSNTVVRGML